MPWVSDHYANGHRDGEVIGYARGFIHAGALFTLGMLLLEWALR